MWRFFLCIVVLCGCSGIEVDDGDLTCPSLDHLIREGVWVSATEDCALRRAREAETPALVYVTTEWCKPCRVLEEGTFSDPEVQAFLRTLVALEVDGSRERFAAVRERYDVHSYPTTILYGPDGEEIDRLFGVLGPDDFLERIRAWLAGRDTVDDLLRRADAAPEDAPLQLEAGRSLARRGRGVEAARLLERAVAAGEGLGPHRAVALAVLGEQVYLDLLAAHEDSIRVLTILATEHPAAPYGPRAWMAMARVGLATGDPEGAEALLVAHVRPEPSRPMEVYRLASFALRYRIAEEHARGLAATAAPLASDKAWLWKALADLERRLGNQDAATAAMVRAVEAAPENRTYRSLLDAWTKGTAPADRFPRPSEHDLDDESAP